MARLCGLIYIIVLFAIMVIGLLIRPANMSAAEGFEWDNNLVLIAALWPLVLIGLIIAALLYLFVLLPINLWRISHGYQAIDIFEIGG